MTKNERKKSRLLRLLAVFLTATVIAVFMFTGSAAKRAYAAFNSNCFTITYLNHTYHDGDTLPTLPVGQSVPIVVDWSLCSYSLTDGFYVNTQIGYAGSGATPVVSYSCPVLASLCDGWHTFGFTLTQPATAFYVQMNVYNPPVGNETAYYQTAQLNVTAPPPPPTPTPTPSGPGAWTNLLQNPSFEGYNSWCVWDNWAGGGGCNGAYDNSYIESTWGAHSGTYYRAHWSGSSWYDVTTYQTITAPVDGYYYASMYYEQSCTSHGVYLFIKDMSTGYEYGTQTLGTCTGNSWVYVSTPGIWFKAGTPLAFEVHDVNAGPNNYWVRFDDANLNYH